MAGSRKTGEEREGNKKVRESVEEFAEERRWYPSPGCSELFQLAVH